jgi:hypothetical protein
MISSGKEQKDEEKIPRSDDYNWSGPFRRNRVGTYR